MKTSELIYMINDELKLLSDDSSFTLEHILFLCSKYRSYLIKTDNLNKKLLQFIGLDSPLYQTICVNLEEVNPTYPTSNSYPCDGGTILRSVDEIPDTLSNISVNLNNFFKSANLVYIDAERFKYQGCNKWLQNLIYTSKLPNGHLYIKSSNPQFRYLKSVTVSGVFTDPEEANKYDCNAKEQPCDFLEAEYPIEDYMVPAIIQYVVQELSNSIYRPTDTKNDSFDNLNELSQVPKSNKDEQE